VSPPANEAETAPIPLSAIDGAALVRAFTGGAAGLRQQAAALNAINVFPVPDGDTGTNMSLTMSAAAAVVEQSSATTAAGVAKDRDGRRREADRPQKEDHAVVGQ